MATRAWKRASSLELGYTQEATLCDMVSERAYDGEISPAPSTYGMPGANIVRSFNQLVFKLSTSILCVLINIEDTEESKMGHTKSTFNLGSANHTVDPALRFIPLFGDKKITTLTSYAAQKTLLDLVCS